MIVEPVIDHATLQEYYAQLPREFCFASKCKMSLLGDITGKYALDIDCRWGKGVIKLSDYVGQRGFVMGVDPYQDWIEIALSFMDESWRRNGLLENNMDYRVAYGEDLSMAGIEDGFFDLVFTNSSINVDYSPEQVLREAYRVLRPGGLLIYDGVIAEEERDGGVVAEARALGNSIQAALSRKGFDGAVVEAGFDAPDYYEEHPVSPSAGYVDDCTVPVVETREDPSFIATTARIYKPRG